MILTGLPFPQALLEKDLAVGEVAGRGKAAVNGDELASHVGNLREGVGGGDILGASDAANGLGTPFSHQTVDFGHGEFETRLADEAAPIPLEEPVTKQAGRDKSLTFG